MEKLIEELKILIVDALELEDVEASEIDPSEPIFGEGLGLDSIDALELGIAVRKKYGVSFPEDKGESRKHFASVTSLAQFISGEGA